MIFRLLFLITLHIVSVNVLANIDAIVVGEVKKTFRQIIDPSIEENSAADLLLISSPKKSIKIDKKIISPNILSCDDDDNEALKSMVAAISANFLKSASGYIELSRSLSEIKSDSALYKYNSEIMLKSKIDNFKHLYRNRIATLIISNDALKNAMNLCKSVRCIWSVRDAALSMVEFSKMLDNRGALPKKMALTLSQKTLETIYAILANSSRKYKNDNQEIIKIINEFIKLWHGNNTTAFVDKELLGELYLKIPVKPHYQKNSLINEEEIIQLSGQKEIILIESAMVNTIKDTNISKMNIVNIKFRNIEDKKATEFFVQAIAANFLQSAFFYASLRKYEGFLKNDSGFSAELFWKIFEAKEKNFAVLFKKRLASLFNFKESLPHAMSLCKTSECIESFKMESLAMVQLGRMINGEEDIKINYNFSWVESILKQIYNELLKQAFAGDEIESFTLVIEKFLQQALGEKSALEAENEILGGKGKYISMGLDLKPYFEGLLLSQEKWIVDLSAAYTQALKTKIPAQVPKKSNINKEFVLLCERVNIAIGIGLWKLRCKDQEANVYHGKAYAIGASIANNNSANEAVKIKIYSSDFRSPVGTWMGISLAGAFFVGAGAAVLYGDNSIALMDEFCSGLAATFELFWLKLKMAS